MRLLLGSQRDSHVPRASQLKPSPWIAAIVNWPAISGNGNTKLEAFEDLRRSFDRFKATNNKLPRPGTKVPIEFADRNRISQHPEPLKEFIERVLELDWAWISDESSLGDFHGDETNDKLIEKIRHVYGVDVSDIPSGNLADKFDRIANNGAAKSRLTP